MILVTLGTQDKSFTRLLEVIDDLIQKKIIKDKVIVQAGSTVYQTKNMDVFDYITPEELDNLVDECDLLITHAGVGSIMAGLRKQKKIIAAPRLAKYKEHTNDHQKQIAEQLAKEGYLLELKDFKKLDKLLQKAKHFTPRKFEGNSKMIIQTIEEFIDQNESKRTKVGMIRKYWKKYREVIMYLVFGVLTTAVNILSYGLVTRLFHQNEYVANVIAWILSVAFAFITNKVFVFESKEKTRQVIIKESFSFFGWRIVSLICDMSLMYLMLSILKWNDMISKILSNVIVVILNYVFSKLFVFNQKK